MEIPCGQYQSHNQAEHCEGCCSRGALAVGTHFPCYSSQLVRKVKRSLNYRLQKKMATNLGRLPQICCDASPSWPLASRQIWRNGFWRGTDKTEGLTQTLGKTFFCRTEGSTQGRIPRACEHPDAYHRLHSGSVPCRTCWHRLCFSRANQLSFASSWASESRCFAMLLWNATHGSSSRIFCSSSRVHRGSHLHQRRSDILFHTAFSSFSLLIQERSKDPKLRTQSEADGVPHIKFQQGDACSEDTVTLACLSGPASRTWRPGMTLSSKKNSMP